VYYIIRQHFIAVEVKQDATRNGSRYSLEINFKSACSTVQKQGVEKISAFGSSS
jgi:hypothetical protein